MVEVQLPVPAGDVEAALEAAVTALGLSATSKGSLKTLPDSVHWHVKRPGLKGTLELTWWEGRLWAKVHPLRNAPWIPDAIEELKKAL